MKAKLRALWHNFARLLCVIFVCLPYRLRAYNKKSVPKKGPLLVLCNHQSFLDPIFSQSYIIRSFYFIARDSLYRIKVFGLLIRSLFTIPIKRDQADVATMKKILQLLKENRPVCLYPEGTRTHDGKIAQIKPGFSLLARRSGATVVPAVIDGAFECWPRTRKFPKLGKVSVIYGEPVTLNQVEQLSDREFADLITKKLRELQTELRTKLNKKPFDYSQNQ